MYRATVAVWLSVVVLVAAFPSRSMGADPMKPATSDYGDRRNWLCWPGADANACDTDLSTTVIGRDGRTTIENAVPAANPPVDCFYVYPTVSHEAGAIAPLEATPEIRRVVADQAARFATKCRLFAPLYRQVTLFGLALSVYKHEEMGTTTASPRYDVGYADIEDAWQYYLKHENHGRGVILIGHSQGANQLIRLIRATIDGRPDQRILVSALLMGSTLTVPEGADVGGDFAHIPLCKSATQIGCVVAYSSFRAAIPPPANALAGRLRAPRPGLRTACVNPEALTGVTELHPYFNAADGTGWLHGRRVDTPFVNLPDMLTARCVSDGGATYLAVTVDGGPKGPRTADIPGDLMVGGHLRPEWGLHLVDLSLAMGDLIALVGHEADAWASR